MDNSGTRIIKISEDVFSKKKSSKNKMNSNSNFDFNDSNSCFYGKNKINSNFDSNDTLTKNKIKCGSKDWNYSDSELSTMNQFSALTTLFTKIDTTNTNNTTNNNYPQEFESLIRLQLQQKIAGYRSQDVEKSLLDETKFVDYNFVLELLYNSQLLCYYCKNPTQLIYSIVRDNKQWTLERLNNRYGHNKDNVVVSCLHCNIHRKNSNSDSYVFSKRLKYQGSVVKLDSL